MHKASEQASYVHGNVLVPVRAFALDPTERSCCICLQPFGSTALTECGSEVPCQLPCGHIFGEVCIASWTQIDNSCPLCRNPVFSFGIDESPTPITQDPLSDQTSTAYSSSLTPQDDVWLDEQVWNSSTYHCPRTVSTTYTDIDALVNFYTSGDSYLSLDSQLESVLGQFLCCNQRGSCQYSGDGDLEDATISHGRLVPSTTIHTKHVDFDLDIVGLGSQFAELAYQHCVWMDEYLDEPSLVGVLC
jgi:hypothetical protein